MSKKILLFAIFILIGVFSMPAYFNTAYSGLLDRLWNNKKSEQNTGIEELKKHTVIVDGKENHYLVAGTRDITENPGAVFFFHGGGGAAKRIAKVSGFHKLGDATNFLTIYPDNSGSRWNDGRRTTRDAGNDIKFVKKIIRQLHNLYDIDKDRLYAAGISNGGLFTQRLACEVPNLFQAFASVAANMPKELYKRCRPNTLVSFLMINGTKDSFMPWKGGKIKQPLGFLGAGGYVISTLKTIAFWRSTAKCSIRPVHSKLPNKEKDGTSVVRIEWPNCKNLSEVILYAIKGGGHGYPGVGPKRRSPGRDIHASRIIYRFFGRHSL